MRSPGRGPLSSPPLVVPDTAVRFTPSPVKKATHEKRCSRFSRSRPIIAAKRPSFLKLSFFLPPALSSDSLFDLVLFFLPCFPLLSMVDVRTSRSTGCVIPDTRSDAQISRYLTHLRFRHFLIRDRSLRTSPHHSNRVGRYRQRTSRSQIVTLTSTLPPHRSLMVSEFTLV